jgi:RNA polymerase sporulation-specific sigma factor
MTKAPKEIKKIQHRLEHKDLLDLFEQYQQTQSQTTRDKIFNANTGLVFSICKKYPQQNQDDLEQYGFIGLLSAIETFDPNKKVRFSTYATRCIINEIILGFNIVNTLIPTPKVLLKKLKTGELEPIKTQDLDNFDIPIESNDNGIDKQLFWFMINKLCTQKELDLLLKRYCSDEELTLQQIGLTVNKGKENTFNHIQRIIKKLKKNEFFKKMIKESL